MGKRRKTMWKTILELGRELQVGDKVRVHNGYDFVEVILDDFWLIRGYVPNGMHSETASLTSKSFGQWPEAWVE